VQGGRARARRGGKGGPREGGKLLFEPLDERPLDHPATLQGQLDGPQFLRPENRTRDRDLHC
jgi:hypothetical protein